MLLGLDAQHSHAPGARCKLQQVCVGRGGRGGAHGAGGGRAAASPAAPRQRRQPGWRGPLRSTPEPGTPWKACSCSPLPLAGRWQRAGWPAACGTQQGAGCWQLTSALPAPCTLRRVPDRCTRPPTKAAAERDPRPCCTGCPACCARPGLGPRSRPSTASSSPQQSRASAAQRWARYAGTAAGPGFRGWRPGRRRGPGPPPLRGRWGRGRRG